MISLLLAIVAAAGLLRKGFAGRSEKWAWSAGAEFERHKKAVGTGEAKDMGFAHLERVWVESLVSHESGYRREVERTNRGTSVDKAGVEYTLQMYNRFKMLVDLGTGG